MEFIDLQAQYQYLKNEIDAEIARVLSTSHFIMGEDVSLFEQELADYVGVKHVISCSDGTSALQLIFMAYGIGSGDAVFCPDMTFIASIEPACLLGATPVFCEIDPISYNLSPESLRRQIKAVLHEGKYKPRAIVTVDFLGNPADFDAIKIIAEEYDLLLIEDAAQAMGATYKGLKCGGLGDVAATSFFPSKPLGCYGDGGAVLTNDEEVAEIIKSLRVHGKGVDKYHNVRIGINSRLDSIQAAILRVKLRALSKEMEMRQDVAEVYRSGLSEILRCPSIAEDSVSAFAQYVLIADSEQQREYMQQTLSEHKIPSIRYYPAPLHLLQVFADVNIYGENYGDAETYALNSFGIPFSPYLKNEDQKEIISVLLNACRSWWKTGRIS